MNLLRTLCQYRQMHRRICNQRKQLAELNKAINMWQKIAEALCKRRDKEK
jgi:hypothetical protein